MDWKILNYSWFNGNSILVVLISRVGKRSGRPGRLVVETDMSAQEMNL
jgi:hypothetical protein